MENNKPIIAILLGDPSGIGPELISKLLINQEVEKANILVIGEKEANSENLSIRDRQTGKVRELSFDDFLNEIKEQTKDKPFTGLNFPKHISKRPNLMV